MSDLQNNAFTCVSLFYGVKGASDKVYCNRCPYLTILKIFHLLFNCNVWTNLAISHCYVLYGYCCTLDIFLHLSLTFFTTFYFIGSISFYTYFSFCYNNIPMHNYLLQNSDSVCHVAYFNQLCLFANGFVTILVVVTVLFTLYYTIIFSLYLIIILCQNLKRGSRQKSHENTKILTYFHKVKPKKDR